MQLRYQADRRTLGFVFLYFALVLGQWVTAPQKLIIAAPLVILTCFFSFFGAVITHNTIHSPVFVGKGANRVFQVILSLTYGSAVSAFVPGHNLSHHKHVQSPRDVMRTTKVRHRQNLLNLLEFAPRVALSIFKNDQAFVKAARHTHKKWLAQYRLESRTVLLVTLLLLALDWKKALVYWLLPHLYAAWGIITMNYLQHDGCDVSHPYNHSRNFVGPIVNFFTFNNGYHGVHHDKPGLHWSLTPRDHKERYSGNIDARLEVKNMLVWFVVTFFLSGRRRTFTGEPLELPPAEQDETWVPRPGEFSEDLGAVAAG